MERSECMKAVVIDRYGAPGIQSIRRVRIPFPEDAPGFMRRLAELMARGQYRGVFDRSYALENIVEAFRYVETEQKTGIVVIHPN